MILHRWALKEDRGRDQVWPGLCQSEDRRPEVRGQEVPPGRLVSIRSLCKAQFLLSSSSEAGVKYLPHSTSGTLKCRAARPAPPWATCNAIICRVCSANGPLPHKFLSLAQSLGGCCAGQRRHTVQSRETAMLRVTRLNARRRDGLEGSLEVVDVPSRAGLPWLQEPAWRFLPQPRGRASSVWDWSGSDRLQSHRCPKRWALSTSSHGWGYSPRGQPLSLLSTAHVSGAVRWSACRARPVASSLPRRVRVPRVHVRVVCGWRVG